MIKPIEGGVCAAKGFLAGGVHCGIRKSRTKRDLALIVSKTRAAAAAVYTQNRVKGAPLLVTREHLADGCAQAVIINSGNANTCNVNGVEIAREMCKLTAEYAGVNEADVIVASTGVIGQEMSIAPIAGGMRALTDSLGADGAPAAEAIMTTDTIKKEVAVEFEIGGCKCALGGMAKGSGMIHPNMATMLIFITTDAAISPDMLKKALSEDVKKSFNMVSVDGDTSTNDMCVILANGLAGNAPITAPGPELDTFKEALGIVTKKLCRMLAGDGEGATKLLECTVMGANSQPQADEIARSVISSSLVKAAMFGADANWGRVMCALGNTDANAAIDKVDIAFESAAGRAQVCRQGVGAEFDEDYAKQILMQKEIKILIYLHLGDYDATAWGCDLTYDYVKINGDYRT